MEVLLPQDLDGGPELCGTSTQAIRLYPDKHIHKFFGATLCSYRRTVSRSIRRTLTKKQEIQKEKDILDRITLPDDEKSPDFIPLELLDADDGGLVFLRPEFLPFATAAIVAIEKLVNREAYKR